jgi:DNA replication ATP-dependent helicase Dna2
LLTLYNQADLLIICSESLPALNETLPRGQECFLCASLNLEPCTLPMLEGRIISAYERTTNNGKTTQFISLRSDEWLASIALTDSYRAFGRALQERGREVLAQHALRLRLYHMAAPAATEEYQGKPRHSYVATPHTLLVLEPDILLNITDLAHANYCSRQYLLNRLVPPAASSAMAMLRGNLVHACFKELLKSPTEQAPLDFLRHQLAEELQRNTIELALAHISPEALYEYVLPHLESLATWYEHKRSTLWAEGKQENRVRAETFLLAPELGLRGRLDLFWQQAGQQSLLELKTAGSTRGDLPKQDHRWQVNGYQAQLLVRHTSEMKDALGTLVYSGMPKMAESYGIPFKLTDLHRVNATRNMLILQHITGVPLAPPGPSRCTPCSLLHQCERASAALGWPLPQPKIKTADVTEETELEADVSRSGMSRGDTLASADEAGNIQAASEEVALAPRPDSDEDRALFAHYYRLLLLEGQEAERQQALLWTEDVELRKARGGVISDLQPVGEPQPTGRGEWHQTFACDNTSELRKGDEILLSDGDPIGGEVVTGTIVEISAQQVTIWTPERIAHPRLLDRYGNDQTHVRTLQNLMRWLDVEPRLRDLVAGRTRPHFTTAPVAPRPDFNAEQNLAVTRALQMQDYLLIQGPPGTGKTAVIAEIVKRLVERGERVLLAAFTNQAVDNMLKRLAHEQFFEYVRLGHERSIAEDEAISRRLLQNLVRTHYGVLLNASVDQSPRLLSGSAAIEADVHKLLETTPVIASTTATWSSDKYAPRPLSQESEKVQTPFAFDVAIIDEASQLTVPALLGALRFAKRFVLVGDEQQLPPLVMSKAAAEQGLAVSLFQQLKSLDDRYRKEHPTSISACVALRIQYRMHKTIARFPSVVFYEEQLEMGEQNRLRVLDLPITGPWLETEQPAITRAIRPAFPLVFLHVASDPLEVKKSQAETEVVRKLVAGLLARGMAPQDIGVIAPYRAQVALLRHTLNAPIELTIDTVDRFQGGERSVIIISFATTTLPQGELLEFITNRNRLNVALTRAQRKLILVGNVPALQELPVFNRLATYCRNMKVLIDAETSQPLP